MDFCRNSHYLEPGTQVQIQGLEEVRSGICKKKKKWGGRHVPGHQIGVWANFSYLRGKGNTCYLRHSWEIQALAQKKCSIKSDWLDQTHFSCLLVPTVLSLCCPQKKWPQSTGWPLGLVPSRGCEFVFPQGPQTRWL